MRIAEYKKIGLHKEQRIIHHDSVYDELSGIETEPAYDETIEIDVSEMGLVYRDMTADEEAEFLVSRTEEPVEEVTAQERINAQALLTAIMTDTLLEDEADE